MKNILRSIFKDNNRAFLLFIESSVTYEDKIEMAKYVLNKNQSIRFAVLCAESVLYIFEEKYPKDSSVRDCINYLKSISDFNNLTEEQIKKIEKHRSAAYAAYYAAYYAANAANAANAADAADAAAYAANAANAAANAADYAAAANAADYAAAANAADAAYAADAADAAYAADAVGDKQKQQELNIEFLKKVVTEYK